MPMTLEQLSAALADRYRVERELGAGGMATVYLAHDLRHDRKVALKVLRPELAAVIGGERFLAEIRTTANLQHPHILALFDSGRVGGTGNGTEIVFYVMPFVEGESLRDRITREKQLPVHEAVRVAREVADALEYAHRHTVIHRDVKPENILLHGGHALVADFGIALAASRSEGGSRMTETGMSLGTPHYMSPEQAMGERDITARSDVYALGCVLYEMLTGEPPFTGPTPQAIVARMMTEEPRSLTLQRKSIPPQVEAAVTTALEKLPADRFPSAAAFAAALEDPAFAGSSATTATRSRSRAATAPSWASPGRLVLATAVLVAAITFGLTRWLAPPGATRDLRSPHVAIPLPEGYELGATNVNPIAISRDGARVAFVGLKDGRNRIFVRAIEDIDAQALEGTEGGDGPFFSPDGKWIGFFAGSKLRKVTVSGAALVSLADAPFHRGGAWGDDGFIYFAPTNVGGIWRVPAEGGAATQVTALDSVTGEISHRWPQKVPGSGTLLFSTWTGPGDEEHFVSAQTLGSPGHALLVRGGDAPQYAPRPGRLLYTHRGQLFSVRWKPSDRALITAVPVTARERPNDGIGNEGSGNYAISDHGTLVYLSTGSAFNTQRLVWVDRSGAITPLPLPERGYDNVAISPDGSRAVIQGREGTARLWVYDFARNTLSPLATGPGSSQAPLWTPDGRRVIYRGTRQGTRNLYWLPVDGSGEEQRLTTKRGIIQTPTSVTPDGRILLYDETGPDEPEGAGMWVRRLDGDPAPRRFLPLPALGTNGQLSPDGRWVAYQATVAARKEVFVAPFEGDGERRLVSTDGGLEPIWSRDGRELFYVSGDRLMGVTVTPGPRFVASAPRVVHTGRFNRTITGNTSFGLTPDGRRFLRIQPVSQQPSITHLELVFDWFGALERQAATGGD